MNCRALLAISLLAGCATQSVNTPQKARSIALSSVCATAEVALDPGEQILTQWSVERQDDEWRVWLPQGPGTKSPGGKPLRSAWIDARTGKVTSCDGRYK